MVTSFTAVHDVARFGAEVLRASPRQADLMVVCRNLLYQNGTGHSASRTTKTLEPNRVISMGACANSGGMYDIYSVVQGAHKFIPVDVIIPGCPLRPEASMKDPRCLQESIGKQMLSALLGGWRLGHCAKYAIRATSAVTYCRNQPTPDEI
ncbi:NADH-quinone oxidoreductase subunit B [Escherichia coli]